jgi:hypothetical protein
MPKHLRPWLRFTVTPPEGGTTPPAPPAPQVGPNGFPEGTKVEDMAVEHQAAYWQHQSRKHEGRSKAKDTTIADLQKQVPPAAPKSDTDKAIDDRIAAALAPVTADLVSARIETAVATRGIGVATIQPLIDGLDLTKFMRDGKPDAEKISAWAAALPAPATAGAPATGTPPATPSPGMGGFQGRGGGQPPAERGMDAMGAEYLADKAKRAASPFS